MQKVWSISSSASGQRSDCHSHLVHCDEFVLTILKTRSSLDQGLYKRPSSNAVLSILGDVPSTAMRDDKRGLIAVEIVIST